MPPVKTKLVNLRVSLQELEGWKSQALYEGLSLSAWIRKRCAQEPGLTGVSVQMVPPVPDGLRDEVVVRVPSPSKRAQVDALLAASGGKVFRGPDFKGKAK